MSELTAQIPPFKITKQVTTTDGVSKFVEIVEKIQQEENNAIIN